MESVCVSMNGNASNVNSWYVKVGGSRRQVGSLRQPETCVADPSLVSPVGRKSTENRYRRCLKMPEQPSHW